MGRNGGSPSGSWITDVGSSHTPKGGKGGAPGSGSPPVTGPCQWKVCPVGKVWDQQQCKCVDQIICTPQPCPPKQVWSQSKCSCECNTTVKQKGGCSTGTHWDKDVCDCIPCSEETEAGCPSGNYYDAKKCGCVDCATPQKCPEGSKWNSAPGLCKCVTCANPPAGEDCPENKGWDPKSCSCKCWPAPGLSCKFGQYWDDHDDVCGCKSCLEEPEGGCPDNQYWDWPPKRCKCMSCDVPPLWGCGDYGEWNKDACGYKPKPCPKCNDDDRCKKRAKCAFNLLTHIVYAYQFNAKELYDAYVGSFGAASQAKFTIFNSVFKWNDGATNTAQTGIWGPAVNGEWTGGACPLGAVPPSGDTTSGDSTWDYVLKIYAEEDDKAAAQGCMKALWQLQTEKMNQCGSGKGMWDKFYAELKHNYIAIDKDGGLTVKTDGFEEG